MKRIMLMALLLVSLLTITAVSADDSTTDEKVLESIGSADLQDEILSADDGTFTALQNRIENAQIDSTVVLENDYKYDEKTAGIKVDKSLTINGNGHTLDGLSKSNIIDVSGNDGMHVTVILENIRFDNGKTAVKSDYTGNLIVKNCTFTNNVANEDGGAINAMGSLTVQKCTFTGNEAENGGAIYSLGDLMVAESVFSDNHAWKDGGAVYINCFYKPGENIVWVNPAYSITYDITLYNCTVRDSTFTGNHAGGIVRESGSGGAIFANGYIDDENNHRANILHSTFGANSATDYDGEIYANDISGWTVKTDCIFLSETKEDDSESSSDTPQGKSSITTLSLKSVSIKKSAKKLTLKATLKTDGIPVASKTVKFKFNGRTYKAQTNAKGIAKVTIKKSVLKKLKAGKKVKYQASYDGITVKKTAKVKK